MNLFFEQYDQTIIRMYAEYVSTKPGEMSNGIEEIILKEENSQVRFAESYLTIFVSYAMIQAT